MANPAVQRKLNIAAVIIAGAVFAVFTMLGAIVTFYTNLLWFHEVGFTAVFWKELATKWAVGPIFGVAFFLLLYVNIWLARRFAPMYPPLQVVDQGTIPFGKPGQPVSIEDFVARARTYVDPYVKWVLLGIAALFALGQGASAASNWLTWLRFANRIPFGTLDPLFNRDLSFYFFTLPVYEWVYEWLLSALILTAFVTALVHVYGGAIRFSPGVERFASHVKGHLSVLLGLIALVKAWGYNLDMYQLLYSTRGQVTGASYTDVNAQLPALKILIVISVITAGLLIVNIKQKGWRLPVAAIGLWIAASIIVGDVYPSLVQQYKVGPNELQAEKPYIKLNIAATREAYKLNGVTTKFFPATPNLTTADLVEDSQTINNIRLWDPGTLKTTYSQLQEIRLYYAFTDVDVDRYKIDGDLREVMISPRELDIRQLPARAQTWVNQHVIYTHGFGAVVSPVNRVTSDGLPDFVIKDVPPQSTTNLKITQPRLYYSEQPDDYVIVRTGRANEFDYPQGNRNRYTQYSGKGGVELSGFWRKAAFAMKYSSLQMFLSPYVTPTSKIMFKRNIRERVDEVAPFLAYDQDPYAAIVGGRIVFVQDAYTVSDRYPYSQTFEGGNFNYIRNSVKVTVDAYDGTMKFYLVDAKDPLARVYAKIFPQLFTSGAAVPADLRAHFRYPEDMFDVQAEMYRVYHMTNPEVFYNKEDMWAIPQLGSPSGSQQMDPYYVLMRPPGAKTEKFILFIPFTPNGKNNMIAWMAASSDPDDYGQLLAFDFPKQRLTFGPSQIDARVNQDPDISKQLTLWSQAGSRVIRGNLLVIPIKTSLLYVQPLYLQAEQSALPQLERVIVAFGDKIAMEPTFAEALIRIFGEAAPVEPPVPSGKKPAGGGKAPVQPGPPATVKSLVSQAAKHYTAAQEAAKRGDWAAYGRESRALGEVLKQLETKSGAGLVP